MRLSETEWVAMKVLWDRGSATAREVHEALREETGWAYTTVRTMLGRLAEKGAVRAVKSGSAGSFEPAVTRRSARRSAVRALIDRAFAGAVGPFLHFMLEEERLSERDRRELRRLLGEKR